MIVHDVTLTVSGIIGLSMIVVLVALLCVGRSRARDGGYQARPLLSAWERRVLVELRAQLPAHLHLCPQVRLGDAFGTTGDAKEKRRAFWRVASKSIDFALIDVRNGDLRLGIELNDRTHQQKTRRARDALVASVFQQAGVPLLCVAPYTKIDLTPYLT